MTSKSLFFNMMKEDMKRRLWTIALTFLAFFFSFPVWVALRLSDYTEMTKNDYLYLVGELNSYFSYQNGWVAFLLILLSLIMGVTSYSYLHNRQKVDFYHGIPVSRTKLFWANYANGILIPGLIYGVNLVAALIVALTFGIGPGQLLGNMTLGFLFFIIHYSMLYTVTVLSMILTGNVLMGILGTGVFHFLFPCVLLVLQLCYDTFFQTSYRGGSQLLGRLMERCSAFMLFFYHMGRNEWSGLFTILGILAVVLAITALMALLALALYKKRGSEAAGKAMAFKITRPIFRIPIVILSSLCGSLFFWAMHESLGWAVFGLLCGMVLSHCVIEIIYHSDFRKLFANRLQMVLCAVAAAVIFCGFRYDLFGYDRYIPAEAKLESVAVSISAMNNWVDYGKVRKTSDGSYEWANEYRDDYIFSNMALKNTAPALFLIEKAIERNQALYHQEGPVNQRADWQWNSVLSVKHKLKSGREVYRSYNLYLNDIIPELKELYADENYLKAVYPVLTQSPEDTAKVKVRMDEETKTVSRSLNGDDKAMTEKLLLTYQEEFKNLTPETMEKENPIVLIQFMTEIQAEAESRKEELQSSWRYSDVISRGYYPLYPSFTKTIALLKECQMDVENWNRVEDEIKEIRIDPYEFKDRGREGEAESIEIKDPEVIDRIMEAAVITDYSGYNGFCTEEQIAVTAINTMGSQIRCFVGISNIPDDIRDQAFGAY